MNSTATRTAEVRSAAKAADEAYDAAEAARGGTEAAYYAAREALRIACERLAFELMRSR
jgi:hypothetical protein